MKWLLSSDPLQGTRTYYMEDAHDAERFHIQVVQDCQPSLEYAKARERDGDYTRRGIKKGWAHGAHVPVVVQRDLFVEYSKGDIRARMDDDYWKFVKDRVMTDPAYRDLRTGPKTLMRSVRG